MVRLNNEMIDQFKNDYITSNNIGTTVLILLALDKEDYEFLDKLDDSNKDKKMILLYRDLVYKGYLNENEDNDEQNNVHFSLTNKSKEIISILNNEIQVSRITTSKIEDKPIDPEVKDKEDIKNWIDDWLKLFPVRRADSYLLRSGKNLAIKKMKMFLDSNVENRFNKNVVFEATKLYLKDQANDGWKYTQIAGNFISKAESGRGLLRNSTLEMYCNLVVNDVKKDDKYVDLEDNNPFA